ncbi:ATP-binding cassette domain-containing protein, partial [Streptomyces sp. NPDC002054]|uniref:ATP-binding cassette domain-containing protein n=1 Tax=Streptomyces sp. NPDC002054 TaxID=3154663 RepID=UPI003322108E
FDLVEAAKKPVITFSGGMKRRLDLAMTLVGRPQVIFLDEPTTGLDPRVRRSMWEMIRGLVADGVTIFLTTQYLEEADQLAEQIAVLDGGRLVAQGTPEELKRKVPGGSIDLQFTTAYALDLAARTLTVPFTRNDEDLKLRIPSDGSAQNVQSVLNRLDTTTIHEMSLHTPDLDDVFLALTGQTKTGTETTTPADTEKKVQV